MCRNIKNYKLIMIGLLIFFTTSFVLADGGKKAEKISVTMRPLSGKEAKELIERIPEIFTGALGEAASNIKTDEMAELKQDTSFLISNLKLKVLTASLLQTVFPNAHFYQLQKLDINPHYSYQIATIGNKTYGLPVSFNRLILGHNLKLNDKNMIELAKAFVIVVLVGTGCKFIEEKLSMDQKKTPPINWVHLKAEVNGQKQIFAFRFRSGQIHWVTRNTEGELDTKWYDLKIIE